MSENLILGQLAPVGTGYFQLLLDDSKLTDAIEVGVMGADDFSFGECQIHLAEHGNSKPFNRIGPGHCHDQVDVQADLFHVMSIRLWCISSCRRGFYNWYGGMACSALVGTMLLTGKPRCMPLVVISFVDLT